MMKRPVPRAPTGIADRSTTTTTTLVKGILLFSILSVGLFNYSFFKNFSSKDDIDVMITAAPTAEHSMKIMEDQPSSSSSSSSSSLHVRSITSYWWPSVEDGGLLGKIHTMQHPADCSSPKTKFLVWRSMWNHEKDTRGLTAWGHAGSSHLIHALTDGDQFDAFGSRVLITDDQLWPMAKGCLHGPETRECYFEGLTSCGLEDVDDIALAGGDGNNNTNLVEILKKNGDNYNATTRTVYTSQRDPWFRIIRSKYSWTNIPGDHSEMAMIAAALAYYFRPKEWLKNEIDKRIKASIPADLNPARTVGVPIRRSDKCKGHAIEGSAAGELDCPPLEKYLNGLKSFLKFDPLIENVIVTSEDKSACEEFLQLLREELPRLRVVQNVGDVQQGTGSGSKLEAYVEGSGNANVVASALTSMHLHLRARYFVITSKSTWTSTIAVMARSYGFASQIFVIDIGPNTNTYGSYARKGS